MPDPIISYPWLDDAQTMVDFQKVKVNGELATDLLVQRDHYRAAITELVEAYGEMEKGIDDPILCHYNGIRLHNVMEDLRALVIPGYEPKYEPNVDEIVDPE